MPSLNSRRALTSKVSALPFPIFLLVISFLSSNSEVDQSGEGRETPVASDAA